MKNFTKQNFKTNPLWIRLLIMAFMLLIGSSSAWADTYLAGDFNNWSSNNSSYKFTYSGNIGTLSISLNAKSTYNFKVVHDGTWYTNPEQGTMTRGNCSNWPITTSEGKDNNTKIMADIQGTYIFKFDKSNKQLTITYPAVTKVKVNGNVYTIYMARPTDTEGENFTAIPNAYTFIATSGTQDECGSSTGEPAKATVNITLEDVVENCDY